MADEPPKILELNTIQQQEQLLHTGILHSRWRILVALLFSTLILVIWFSTNSDNPWTAGAYKFGSFSVGGGPSSPYPYRYVPKQLTLMPILVNAATWVVWSMRYYFMANRGIKLELRSDFESMEYDSRRILDRFQYSKYAAARQWRDESRINLLVALQFILMGMLFAFSIAR